MSKKLTRLEKSTKILKDAKITKWCYVDTENEFNFMNQTYVISQSVEEYKVYNKAGTVDDYTNEAYMEEILVIVNLDNEMLFYNQNYGLIEKRLVRVKE